MKWDTARGSSLWIITLTRTFNSLVVVGINADFFLFLAKCIVTTVQCFEFMVTLEVRPAPDPTVYNMWKSLPVGNLKASVERPRNRHTLAELAGAREGSFQLLHGPLLLLELLDERVHRFLRPFLLLVALLPTQQTLHHWASKGKQACHRHLGLGFSQWWLALRMEALSKSKEVFPGVCTLHSLVGKKRENKYVCAHPRRTDAVLKRSVSLHWVSFL